MNCKQVIVIRKDLKMRRGKEIAQGAHASLSFLSDRIRKSEGGSLKFSKAEKAWLSGSFAKITCSVDSEEELLELFRKAKAKGLQAHLITDSGRTEFNGVPTNTCIAIGPDESHKIDEITGNLKLY
jgi:PTH2 family peptidyl-tRNA hydrolase